MDIRKTAYEDLPRIMDIYAQARQFMVQQGNPRQWAARSWPPESLIRQDIAAGKSYVCEADEGIVGVFYFDHGHRIDPTYARIDGGVWVGNDDYGVVHRIASCQKGVGSFCIQWAYSQCGHLRIDTHADNKAMQNLLKKLGFIQCGTIYVNEDKDPRIAFEKCPALTVQVDRPLGSHHPKHPDICYPVNYGFIPGLFAPDGEEQDAYILGVDTPADSFKGKLVAVIHRKNDVEDKWVIAPENMHFTEAEIRAATHFQEQYFDIDIRLL